MNLSTFHVKVDISTLKEVFKIKKFDLAIIGAGPIGLFAASYAQLHNLKTVVFESLSEIGGQPKMLYPFKNIYDVPGFSQITANDLITSLSKQINTTKIVLNHSVKNIIQSNKDYIIDGDYLVRSIIIATGNGAFKPKKLPLPINGMIKQHLHYFIKDPNFFKNKKIGILGGGDSALDYALQLANHNVITLIHRRNSFRGLESSIAKLKQLPNVTFNTPFLPLKIEEQNNQILLSLKEVGTDQLVQQKFDEIIVAYGFRANNIFVKNWGIELIANRIAVKPEMKTNLPGIYAAGDVTDYLGRVPIIGVGFGEVQIAINAIMKELFPEKKLTIHSTSI